MTDSGMDLSRLRRLCCHNSWWYHSPSIWISSCGPCLSIFHSSRTNHKSSHLVLQQHWCCCGYCGWCGFILVILALPTASYPLLPHVQADSFLEFHQFNYATYNETILLFTTIHTIQLHTIIANFNVLNTMNIYFEYLVRELGHSCEQEAEHHHKATHSEIRNVRLVR